MLTVRYDLEFPYPYDLNGERFPRLTFRLTNPENPGQSVDVDAYLDSGAQRSLFDGGIGRAVGIDLLTGDQKQYESATGSSIAGRLHRVRLEHPDLGSFDLEVGFSSSRIKRNLLGRDFFNLVQIGFRERRLAFYVTPEP